MALQSDAIESRLEGLKQDDRRMMFDSKLRAFRLDNKAPALSGSRTSKSARKEETTVQVDQIFSLLEELSRRIDGLERKDRSLAGEIRRQARNANRRRSMVAGGGALLGVVYCICWFMKPI